MSNLENIRESVQYVLEENGYDREYASACANRLVTTIKRENASKDFKEPSDVFVSIFGGFRNLKGETK